MPFRSIVFVVITLLAAAAPSLPGATAEGPARSPVSANAPAGWERTLDAASRYVRGRTHIEALARNYREALKRVQEEAGAAKAAAERESKAAQDLLDALDPAQAREGTREGAEVAAKRRQYTRDVAQAGERLALADLALRRARELEAEIGALARASMVERLLSPLPTPFAPAVVAKAVPEAVTFAATILQSPAEWWNRFADADREQTLLWRGLFVVVLALGVAVAARRALLGRFGQVAVTGEPSIARRLLAAAVEAIARGLVPAVLLGGALAWVSREDALFGGVFGAVIVGGLVAALVVTIVPALTRAVLAPSISVWRIVAASDEQGRGLARRVEILAAVFAADLFFQTVARSVPISAELTSLYVIGATAAEAILLTVVVAHPVLKGRGGGLWRLVRRLLGAVVLVSVGAAAVGYGWLGRYLIEATLYSTAIFTALFLLRELVAEGIDILLGSEIARTRLNVSSRTLQRLKFWLAAGVDPGLALLGLFLAAPFWGLPYRDMIDSIVAAAKGFRVGNITFSPVAIVTALAVFFLGMAVTRLIQRKLMDGVLPETRLDAGAQHSLTAGIGYVGFIVAVALAVAVAGVDLTNVALVAGALSVGIGFGLQNIVNNFVSGLTLLVERPIRVGDWVVIGAHEGLVRRISFRSTEIETWQRASVIIPNAEILSTAVVNWTFNDRTGRIEILVGVAYGSDTAKVRDVLEACARAHPRVLADPAPVALFRAFGESSLDFELRCFTDNVMERLAITSDLLFAIDRRFREEGIEIPFPHQVVYHIETPRKKT
ncbi:MAG: mechanosensitive ion channel family protein [Acidimicrobiia bacterium]|nr:mechanosensitive ion channel family protein [Acidimicrobiia bacterium]